MSWTRRIKDSVVTGAGIGVILVALACAGIHAAIKGRVP